MFGDGAVADSSTGLRGAPRLTQEVSLGWRAWDCMRLTSFTADNNNSIHVVGSTAERIHELRPSNVVLESAGLDPVRSE